MQLEPLKVKALGAGFAVVRVAVKPTVTEPAAGIVAVHGAEVTLTSGPLCVAVPPHRLVMRWLSGKVQRRVQPLIAELPVLRMVI